MTAQVLHIEEKTAPLEYYPSVPSNFVLRDGDQVPAETVLGPDVELYCLDDSAHRALFVQTPPGTDLAGAPFFYLAQYRAAVRLLAVPYDELHRLAEPLPDPDLVLLYSVGRCGSTLLSRGLNAVPGVRSLSEPDVLSDLAMLRYWEPAREDELGRLVRSCLRILGRSTPTLAVKPRGGAIGLADLVRRQFPAVHDVFLYRNAERWMDSMHAGFTPSLPSKDALPTFLRYFLSQAGFAEKQGRPPYLAETYALTWLSMMDRYVTLRAEGVPFLPVRYEELTAAPRETLAGVLAWCGLPAGSLDAVLATFGTDSQSGTNLSRSARSESAPPPLDDEDYALARAVLASHPTVTDPAWTDPLTP
jgi:hypothetical protein